MNVAIYVYTDGNNAIRLDTFGDESINFISKGSDLSDAAKIFADFTQTFTVPCSDNNNIVFNHYYNSDIDNGFNANIRANALIEIDTLPFRSGKIQLELVTTKNNVPDFYKATFYGDLKSLKDRFGDDELTTLGTIKSDDGNQFSTNLIFSNHPYTGNNVMATFAGNGFSGVEPYFYPLITSKRVWRYGTGTDKDPNDSNQVMDISENAGAINYYELKPAIQVYEIIRAIEQRYGITFSREFFDRAEFRPLYLWCSNNAGNMITSPRQRIYVNVEGSQYWDRSRINVGGTSVIVQPESERSRRVTFQAYILDSSAKLTYNLGMDMIINGVTTSRKVFKEGCMDDDEISFYMPAGYANNQQVTLRFFIESTSGVVNFTGKIIGVAALKSGILFNNNAVNTQNFQTALGEVVIASQLPKIKVMDFFSSLIKMFNLVIRPISETEFYIDTLNNYYANGDVLDITEYVDNSEVTYGRPNVYKDIKFSYEKTEAILGKNWRETFGGFSETGYSDAYLGKETLGLYDASTENLEVKLPFETMLFENLTDISATSETFTGDTATTNILVGSAFDKTYSTINMKPLFLYKQGTANIQNNPFKFKLDGGVNNLYEINNIDIVGNENFDNIDLVTNSLNYNTRIRPLDNELVRETMYSNYWENFITNTYNPKQRKVTFKNSVLPVNILNQITLNDKLNIGDKQYRISEFNIDLTNGESQLTLMNNLFDSPFVDITDSVIISNNSVFYAPSAGKPDTINLTISPSIHFLDYVVDVEGPWTIEMRALYSGVSVYIGARFIVPQNEGIVITNTSTLYTVSGTGKKRLTLAFEGNYNYPANLNKETLYIITNRKQGGGTQRAQINIIQSAYNKQNTIVS